MKIFEINVAAPAVPLKVWRASNFGLTIYLKVEKWFREQLYCDATGISKPLNPESKKIYSEKESSV